MDAVNPGHYQLAGSDFQVIDLTEQLDFTRGNAVKYLARAGKKNPDTELEDLKKAQWYVNRAIEKYEREHPDEARTGTPVRQGGSRQFGGSRKTV